MNLLLRIIQDEIITRAVRYYNKAKISTCARTSMIITISIMLAIVKKTKIYFYNKKRLIHCLSMLNVSKASSLSQIEATVSNSFHHQIPTCVTSSTRSVHTTRNHCQCPCQPKRSGQNSKRRRLTSTMAK